MIFLLVVLFSFNAYSTEMFYNCELKMNSNFSNERKIQNVSSCLAFEIRHNIKEFDEYKREQKISLYVKQMVQTLKDNGLESYIDKVMEDAYIQLSIPLNNTTRHVDEDARESDFEKSSLHYSLHDALKSQGLNPPSPQRAEELAQSYDKYHGDINGFKQFLETKFPGQDASSIYLKMGNAIDKNQALYENIDMDFLTKNGFSDSLVQKFFNSAPEGIDNPNSKLYQLLRKSLKKSQELAEAVMCKQLENLTSYTGMHTNHDFIAPIVEANLRSLKAISSLSPKSLKSTCPNSNVTNKERIVEILESAEFKRFEISSSPSDIFNPFSSTLSSCTRSFGDVNLEEICDFTNILGKLAKTVTNSRTRKSNNSISNFNDARNCQYILKITEEHLTDYKKPSFKLSVFPPESYHQILEMTAHSGEELLFMIKEFNHKND